MAAYSLDLRKRVLRPGIVAWTRRVWRRNTRWAGPGSIDWCSGGARRARSRRGSKRSFGRARCPI